jgi:hypothetical protein
MSELDDPELDPDAPGDSGDDDESDPGPDELAAFVRRIVDPAITLVTSTAISRAIPDLEPVSRLTSILAIVEHEGGELTRLGDERLEEVLDVLAQVRAELVATIVTLGPLAHEN